MSLYELLGVGPQADAAAIQAAYEAALRALPPTGAGRFRAWLGGRSSASLTHAFKVLIDPAARQAYDRQLQANAWQSLSPPGH